ncbi:DUF2887 domain-containing protein [Aerosakkonema funiforme]
MKTDTIFYRLFQSFPSIFFELIERFLILYKKEAIAPTSIPKHDCS